MHEIPKILIVDDNRINSELIKAQLKAYNYETIFAYDGEEALAKVVSEKPDLVLLDLMMPRMSGFEVCRAIKEDKRTQFTPIVVITALQELTDKLKAIELGADEVLIKPFNKLELLTRIKSLLKIKSLHDDLDTTESILFSLVEALEAKDVYTRGHSERVSLYATKLAAVLGLNTKELEDIRRGGLLHDIGKIGVKEYILSKEGKLTPDEMEQVRIHPVCGHDICKPLQSLKNCLPCIRNHHERYDGNGYPDKLKGDDIPIKGMIIAVADAFDAITTNRPYRGGKVKEEALRIFENEIYSGQWNPLFVKEFIQLLKNESDEDIFNLSE